jgi:hypothetical protein
MMLHDLVKHSEAKTRHIFWGELVPLQVDTEGLELELEVELRANSLILDCAFGVPWDERV